MSPPRIKMRGNRTPIPTGYLVGRVSSGRGDQELINLQSLRQMGIATHQDVAASVNPAGFGFFAGGHLADHELLGAAVFARPVQFVSPDPANVVTSLVGATGAAAFTMVVGGLTVGTITMAGTVGTVAWSGGNYTLAAGTPMSLFAPTPADATLASVSGIVTGSKS